MSFTPSFSSSTSLSPPPSPRSLDFGVQSEGGSSNPSAFVWPVAYRAPAVSAVELWQTTTDGNGSVALVSPLALRAPVSPPSSGADTVLVGVECEEGCTKDFYACDFGE